MKIAAVGLAIGFFICSACSSSALVAAGTACTPGATQICVGSGGCQGGQSCVADGSGFGPCDCGNGRVRDGGPAITRDNGADSSTAPSSDEGGGATVASTGAGTDSSDAGTVASTDSSDAGTVASTDSGSNDGGSSDGGGSGESSSDGDAAAPSEGGATSHPSCAAWQAAGASTDGDYRIAPFQGQPAFTVYCHGMGQGRLGVEYLTLVSAAAGANQTNFVQNFPSTGTTTTSFARVRLILSPLSVDRNDRTFATITANGTPNMDVRCLRYASAGSTVSPYPNMAGWGNVDLTGTPFVIASSVMFVATGYIPECTASFSPNRAIVNLKGGGYAGWCNTGPDPTNDMDAATNIDMALEYAP